MTLAEKIKKNRKRPYFTVGEFFTIVVATVALFIVSAFESIMDLLF